MSADGPSAREGSQADRIRSFALERYVRPALARGDHLVTIVSGEVHREMGLQNAMPAVCSALGRPPFEAFAGVRLTDRQGPANSSTVRFTFELGGSEADWAAAELRRRYGAPIGDTQKMLSFQLADGRQLALERGNRNPQLWLEDDPARPAAPVEQVRHYLPEQSRNSNLPARLKHEPPGGAAPRRVSMALIAGLGTLRKVLDWYEGAAPPLNRHALERLRRLFTNAYSDFHSFEDAGSKFHLEEDEYKRVLIGKVEAGLASTGDGTDEEASRAVERQSS